MLYVPVNIFTAISGRFSSLTSIMQRIGCLAKGHNTVPRVLLERFKPAIPQLELKSNTTMNRPLRSSAVHVDLPLSLLRLISMIGLFQLTSSYTHSEDPLCKHIEQFICVDYIKDRCQQVIRIYILQFLTFSSASRQVE